MLAWGKIYKRGLFDEIRFPLGKIHEDEFVIHHLLYKANKIAVTTEQLYFYYQRNDSIMGEGFNLKGRFHAAQAFEDRAKLFNELGLVKSRDHMYRMLFHIYRQIIEYENININEEYLNNS